MKDEFDSHEGMWAVCRKLPTDFEPYGERKREEGADCSGGCRFFVPLHGDLAFNWGVCANAKSPRAGLLTFEHQGCPEFEAEEGAETEVSENAAGPGVDPVEGDEDPRLQPLAIDWNSLELALDSSSDMESEGYLNKRTGEIIVIFSYGDDEEELRERVDEDLDAWIQIEPIDSRTGFAIMERFASSRKKAHVRKLLSDALSGPRPFRRFKDVVHQDEDLRQEWFDFQAIAEKEAIEEWLAGYDIKPEWK